MHKKPQLILLFIAFLSLLCPALQAERSIRVGAFMINEFGKDAEAEYERSLLGLANIIREMNVDVLALQGVRDTDSGYAQTKRLVSLLNRAAKAEDKPAYEVAFGPSGEKEVATFIHRSTIALIAEPNPIITDNLSDEQGRKRFELMPHYARFRAGDFEFDLLSIHSIIYPFPRKTHQGRAVEFTTIANWVREQESTGGPSVIIAGVSNRFLRDNVWNRLQGPTTDGLLRFPLMEAISKDHPDFDPQTSLAPSVEHNTVTNQNRRRLWDTIAVSRSAFGRLADQPQWNIDAGLVAFDQQHQYLWVTGEHANTIRYLTDHRPIWIQLSIQD